MTTHNATAQGPFLGTRPSYGGPGVLDVVKLHVDMGDVSSGLAATINATTPDTIYLWDIPVGTMIVGVLVDVTTAEGAACTASIADSGGQYVANTLDLNAVAKTGMAVGDTYGLASKVYSATETLNLVFTAGDTDVDTAVFDVYVYCLFNQDVWA
jgi:hypothetical protein